MPNRLAGETSPYLLQHAHNPVDWFPWGPDALARAKLVDRPIFLSIGYAACHWCHVMERESFEDEATASYLNDHFVSIKVDREERPDLDQVYMAAVQAMTGGGGWPMTVFLTPDGRPFYGGTYFPDEPRHGIPSFRQVLEGVDRAWRQERNEVEAAGGRLVAGLIEQGRLQAGIEDPTGEILRSATTAIEVSFDPVNGGWGRAPKFPQPMTIEYLLRRHLATGDDRALSIARRSLDAMADGGIHDQLGGGFHRYSTDEQWLVPHFEQMLYDNAQLSRVYLHAWQVTGDPRYLTVATGTLDYMIRELTTGDGAFAASQDADTNGEEGLTFTWRADEVRAVLGADAELFAAAHDVTDAGNWEGATILHRVTADAELAQRVGLEPAEVEARLASARERLLGHRRERPQPARDDKALAAWNGLAIAAFADA
ncbi:MAG: thioredoxin domain-containing protein, partial [Chloroflexota bacterium]